MSPAFSGLPGWKTGERNVRMRTGLGVEGWLTQPSAPSVCRQQPPLLCVTSQTPEQLVTNADSSHRWPQGSDCNDQEGDPRGSCLRSAVLLAWRQTGPKPHLSLGRSCSCLGIEVCVAFSAATTPEKPSLSSWACSSPASLSFHSLICGRTCAAPSSHSPENSRLAWRRPCW